MEIRHNIRQRRQEKIRNLQHGLYTTPHLEREAKLQQTHAFQLDEHAFELPLDHSMKQPDVRELDPEREWKRKWQQEISDLNSGNIQFPENPPASSGRFLRKLVISCALFAAIWGLTRWEHPLAHKGKEWVRLSLEQSWDTTALAGWYEKRFGMPSFLPALNVKQEEAKKVASLNKHYFAPVQGEITGSYTAETGGMFLQGTPGSPVFAVDTGVVVGAADSGSNGYTVIIQHANGLRSIYGLLGAASVQVNDWIKGGETVGVLAAQKDQASARLFFALIQQGKTVDPADVIVFD